MSFIKKTIHLASTVPCHTFSLVLQEYWISVSSEETQVLISLLSSYLLSFASTLLPSSLPSWFSEVSLQKVSTHFHNCVSPLLFHITTLRLFSILYPSQSLSFVLLLFDTPTRI
jgi:hypothetical protein